jgi:hypothetical protein
MRPIAKLKAPLETEDIEEKVTLHKPKYKQQKNPPSFKNSGF